MLPVSTHPKVKRLQLLMHVIRQNWLTGFSARADTVNFVIRKQFNRLASEFASNAILSTRTEAEQVVGMTSIPHAVYISCLHFQHFSPQSNIPDHA